MVEASRSRHDQRITSKCSRETPDSPLRDDRYRRLMDAAGESAYDLAEWYLPELTEQAVEDMVARLDVAAAVLSGEGMPVRLLLTLAVPEDEVLYGLFGAHSLDLVSRTCDQAGLPYQRLSGDVGTRIRQEPVIQMCAGDAAAPESTAL